jgi:hypothetical protein
MARSFTFAFPYVVGSAWLPCRTARVIEPAFVFEQPASFRKEGRVSVGHAMRNAKAWADENVESKI